MTAATALWKLLRIDETKVPKGTREYRVDAALCVKVAKETGLDAADLFEAFGPDVITGRPGQPVKRMYKIVVGWAQVNAPGDLTEQTEMILKWASKHNPKVLPLKAVS